MLLKFSLPMYSFLRMKEAAGVFILRVPINLFSINALLLYLPKTSETRIFFDVFGSCRSETLVENGNEKNEKKGMKARIRGGE